MSRRYRGLAGLLTAEGISLFGTRLSMIALPWFVISSTGSAALTGLVAFAETAPYVAAKAFGGPLIDRHGPRRVVLVADLVSMTVVGAIPLLHALDRLPLATLLVLVALLGLFRGPGDAAKKTLIPDVAARAEVPLERATGLSGTLERLATTAGAAVAGALVAAVGPLPAMTLNAATFFLAPVIISLTVAARPAGADVNAGGYVDQLRRGAAFLVRDRLLRSLTGMVAVTNFLESAMFSLLLPVWAHSTGQGPGVVGLLAAVNGGVAVGSAFLASVLAHRLPRRITFLISFLVAGPPRFLILALDAPLWVVVGVWAVAGFGQGFINPIVWAVIFERIPQRLRGRVQSLIASVAWVGIPVGPLAGGALVGLAGIAPVFVVFAGVFLVATTLPGLQREWSQMDRRTMTTQG